MMRATCWVLVRSTRATERWPMSGTNSGYDWSTHAPAMKPSARTRIRAPPRRATLRFMPGTVPAARASAAEPDAGILVHAVDPDLEVHVRSRRPPGRALIGDEVAAR